MYGHLKETIIYILCIIRFIYYDFSYEIYGTIVIMLYLKFNMLYCLY